MIDRELLELAAKAENREWFHYSSGHGKGLCCKAPGMSVEYYWNPLEDDGDALRLAVKLYFDVSVYKADEFGPDCTIAAGYESSAYHKEAHSDDPYAATRRAIVLAAAELGKEL